jgi:hypothetical protein
MSLTPLRRSRRHSDPQGVEWSEFGRDLQSRRRNLNRAADIEVDGSESLANPIHHVLSSSCALIVVSQIQSGRKKTPERMRLGVAGFQLETS